MYFNSDALIAARNLRGLTGTALAKLINVSQGSIAKWEAGLVPSEESITLVASALGVHRGVFTTGRFTKIPVVHYRKRASMSVAEDKKITSRLNFLSLQLERALDHICIHTDCPSYSRESGTPQDIARFLRAHWNVSVGPIPYLFKLLESNGIMVIQFFDCHEKFDGISMVTDGGTPIILLNGNKPYDRQRFSLAHELGHICMHMNNPEGPVEQEANDFASEFLMPEEFLDPHLQGLNWQTLPLLKQHWKQSMKSIIYRAKQSGYLSDERALYFYRSAAIRGKDEPYPLLPGVDMPELYKLMLQRFQEDLELSDEELFEVFMLPSSEVLNWMSPGLRQVANDDRPIVKVDYAQEYIQAQPETKPEVENCIILVKEPCPPAGLFRSKRAMRIPSLCRGF